jgi:hypothetical protein
MTGITAIAPELYRLSTCIPEIDLQFDQFLSRDEEPLLFHTGLNKLFPDVREAVGRLIHPSRLRRIGFSHYAPLNRPDRATFYGGEPRDYTDYPALALEPIGRTGTNEKEFGLSG